MLSLQMKIKISIKNTQLDTIIFQKNLFINSQIPFFQSRSTENHTRSKDHIDIDEVFMAIRCWNCSFLFQNKSDWECIKGTV